MAEQLSMDAGKTVILIEDYQNRQLSGFTDEYRGELLKRANTVLDKARGAGIPVFYVEVRRGERTPESEIHSAILPKPGEPVFTKSRVGPFSTTNLDEELRKKGIETLVVMGIATSGCVLSTVRWAADIGYKQVVVSDCCADRDEEVNRVLLEKVIPRQATMVTSEDLFKALNL
jgi:nicotinamidase-related amidase